MDGSGMERWREGGKKERREGERLRGGGFGGWWASKAGELGSSAGKRYVSFFSLDRRARSEKGGEGRGQQEGGGGQVRRKEVRERRLRERGRGVSSNCVAPTLAGSAGLRKAPHWGRWDVRLRLPSVIVREDEEEGEEERRGTWTIVPVR